MGALGEHLHVGLVVGINLTALENLQANGAILVVGEERATTRLTHILHNTTDAHRTVQLFTQISSIGLLALCIGAEILGDELCDLSDLGVGRIAIEDFQILEGLLL